MAFRIEAVELRRVEMPLVAPFRASFGTEAVRDVLLVHVLTQAADGWGECVARSEPLYSPEFVEAAALVTRDHLLPRVWVAARPGDVGPLLRPVKGHPMAKGAVEMAVLDAWLRASGDSLAAHLGGTRQHVDVGVSVGIAPSIGSLVKEVSGYVEDGYRRVKLKIEPGWDVEPVAAVRSEFPGLWLQVDANGAYAPGDGEVFAALDGFGLLFIEQPFGDDDLDAHATLAQRLSTPICLDESITSAARAAEAIDRGACSIVNVKAGRVGGYLEAKVVHDVCLDRRAPVWCGGMLETGLGRAANLALASLPGFTYPADLSASDRYFSHDLTRPFVLEGSQLAVPSGPGIGVEPLPEALEEFTTWAAMLRP